MKNEPRCSGPNIVKEVLEVIKETSTSLRSHSSNGSHHTSTAIQVGQFGDEMPLEVPSVYGATPTLCQ